LPVVADDRTPTDIAYGIDYAGSGPDEMHLARLRLGRPEVIEYIGAIDLPGDRVLDACDFQGNDFSTLYCLDTENSAFSMDDRTDLYTLDIETAKLTYITSFHLTGVDAYEWLGGLTYDPTTGRMFAASCDPLVSGGLPFKSFSTLYELNLEALTLTQIGNSADGPCLKALGADERGNLWGVDDAAKGLSSIDKETGEITFVGSFGVEHCCGVGMEFDPSDNTCYVFLWLGSGGLYQCNTRTGHADLVGKLGEEQPGSGHWGTGAIAAPSGCHLSIAPAAAEIRAGAELSVRVRIVHNRAKTVTVPFTVAVEDLSGRVVASHTTDPRTMRVGDHLEREVTLRLPSTLSPGAYDVSLTVGEMEQGKVRVSKTLRVLSPS
jgi:hypothetical protein